MRVAVKTEERVGRRMRKMWIVLSMPLFGWCVAKRGENFMYAKFHREMPNAKKEAEACAKRLNALGRERVNEQR
jgi:hypothetical protein